MPSQPQPKTSPLMIGLWGFIACTGSLLGYCIYSHTKDIISRTPSPESEPITQISNLHPTAKDRKTQSEMFLKSMMEKEQKLIKKYSSKKETNTDDSQTNFESRRNWEKQKDKINEHLRNFKFQPDAPEGSIKASFQNQLKQLNEDKPTRF